jgi:uncharacterized protein
MDIHFRPHHFLCALCFQGRGYSPTFVDNFKAIMAYLNSVEGEKTSITVVAHTDSICHPCPHRSEKTCTTEEQIALLDHAHAHALAIQANDKLTWHQAKERMAEKITLETFHRICASCSWKEVGICEAVVKQLNSLPLEN